MYHDKMFPFNMAIYIIRFCMLHVEVVWPHDSATIVRMYVWGWWVQKMNRNYMLEERGRERALV